MQNVIKKLYFVIFCDSIINGKKKTQTFFQKIYNFKKRETITQAELQSKINVDLTTIGN